MTSFQYILEECLTALSNDTATVDECLARYPQYAEQLKPLLGTIRYLKLGRSVKPSLAFKSYSRVHLTNTCILIRAVLNGLNFSGGSRRLLLF